MPQSPGENAAFRANQLGSQTQQFARPPINSIRPQHPTPHQASVMSPSFSSAFNIPQSPAHTPTPSATQAGLLNLLKFGPNPNTPQASPHAVPASRPTYGGTGTHSAQGRGLSASSDLLASFTSGKSSASTPHEKPHAMSSTNHQDALLRLLNKTTARPESTQRTTVDSIDAATKPLTEDTAVSALVEKHPSITEVKRSASGRHESPIRLFGSNEQAEPTPFEPVVSPKAESSQKSDSIFTYVNPFEQLAASSPRNVNFKTPANGDKRKIKSPTPPSAIHASSRRKLTPIGGEVLQSIESPTSDHANNGRSQTEALMGINAPSQDPATVAEALNEVGDQVDRQVERALAIAEVKSKSEEQGSDNKQVELDQAAKRNLEDIEKEAHDVAAEVKKELDKAENQGLLEGSMPKPVAEAVKDVIDEAASGKVVDDWESAEGEGSVKDAKTSRIIQVHQFPMRPFVSIDLIQKDHATLTVLDDAVINVARFKKDFDQADRTLATATHEFIVYGMPKGGIRVIQQDNGHHSSVFSNTQDRIFNVGISTAPSGSSLKGTQTVIATGVSGTVYWTTIAKSGEEVTQETMEKQGLMIPPVPSQTDSTSGGQLKTRAKKSNRHPEIFAIGRGKAIQLIFTAHAQSSELVTKEGLMDSEKYFADRNLKVTTGKAGKDFTFSEDDSAIASLDKAGKLRIWDVRDLINEANAAKSLMTPVEVKTPILTFSTAHSTEKSWPTSVLFVDKLRPYTKGTALRYIIVGMKQNHSLQLWDLCLGKAVQELSFPHEHETDAICSITYHPASGIIAVGHPTRNSIYFIHLSAPKYNLPAMSQAKFMQRLAMKDSTLPKAEATAIMSGMREYSFDDRGHIRSIELLSSSTESSKLAEEYENQVLFELYVMHSKGVTCLSIKREDLGWSRESKVTHPVDAEKEGLIVIKELREPSAPPTSEISTVSMNGDAHASAPPSKTKAVVKENIKPAQSTSDLGRPSPAAGVRSERKKSKRSALVDTATGSQRAATPPSPASHVSAGQQEPSPIPQTDASASKEMTRPSLPKHASRDAPESTPTSLNDQSKNPIVNGESINVGISTNSLEKELKQIERGVSDEFNKVLGRELEALYRRFSEDKRVQDAAGAAKQDAMLRLVSSTLSENVEKSLSRIIHQNIQDAVVPSITDVTSSVLKAKVSSAVAQQVEANMGTTLKRVLPGAIDRTMQSPQVLRSISEQITKMMIGHVEQQFSSALDKTIVPAFADLALSKAQKMNEETERRVREQLQQVEVQRREDSIKIDQLTNLVRGLSETIHTMAAAQSDFQIEILKQQRKAAEKGPGLAQRHSPTPSESASMNVTPEQEELDAVTTAMNEGRFEEATIMVCDRFAI